MGVDLTLLVVDGDCGTWGFAHTVISLTRECELWDAIESLNPTPRPEFTLSSYIARIPDGSWKDERGYGEVKQTPYGDQLTYLPAAKLAAGMKTYYDNRPGELDRRPETKAALAYIGVLPPNRSVALFWY